mgnify:CR=1 FL=1
MRVRESLLALSLILPTSLAGQSVLGSSGLGLRAEPLDAIQRALGGAGVVTRTAVVLPGNPLAALDILAPTIAFTVQPYWGTYTVGLDEGDFSSTRFPVIGFAYPLGTEGVVTLTAGSQFDQNWSVKTSGSVDIRGQNVGLTDTFLSDGAITAIQLGWARRMTTTLALGVSIGVYRGGLTRRFTRAFDQQDPDSVTVTTVGTPIQPAAIGGRWSHSGPLASLNLSWDPSPILQVGAAANWGGKLNVNPETGSEGFSREVSVPMEFKVAASAAVFPTFTLSAGTTFSNWTDLGEPSIDEAAAGETISYGAGVEWDRLSFWAGPLPIRVGFRRSDQPFLFLGNEVKESTYSFGFSVVMAQALDLPLAAVDVAIEAGKRTSGNFEESFRRLTITTRIGGN